MQYVLMAKELTELAKEVAGEVSLEASRLKGLVPHETYEPLARAVLRERGIQWCDDE